jgi:hypothetical protein
MAIQLPRRGDGADGRAMITGPPCLQDRGVPPGRIGADDTGQRIEARFVSEKDRLPRRWRPFWSAGQGSWRQRAIAPSSRWRARRAGCCRLHWIALHKRSYTFSLRIIQLPENQVASLRFTDLRGGTRDGTRPAVLHLTFRTEALIVVHMHLYNQGSRFPRSWRRGWCSSVRLSTVGHGRGRSHT